LLNKFEKLFIFNLVANNIDINILKTTITNNNNKSKLLNTISIDNYNLVQNSKILLLKTILYNIFLQYIFTIYLQYNFLNNC